MPFPFFIRKEKMKIKGLIIIIALMLCPVIARADVDIDALIQNAYTVWQWIKTLTTLIVGFGVVVYAVSYLSDWDYERNQRWRDSDS